MKFIQILGKIKKTIGSIMLKKMYYLLLFHMLGILKLWNKSLGLA